MSSTDADERRKAYEAANPLGGPARMFEAIASRIRAGEDYHEVLRDYDLQHISRATASSERAVEGVSVETILATADHIEQNGMDLSKLGGDEQQEGRCRELCAMYLRELVQALRIEQRLALISETPDSETAKDALAAFGLSVIKEARGELGDLDGGWIQDEAERLGVLRKVEVTEPCGELCHCAEYGDFPQDCYRIVADGDRSKEG